jgi:predicted dehydrogenase
MNRIGIILNGVTGRMGTNQHLVRSLLAIRAEGGVLLSNGTRLYPELLLVGRNESKLRELCARHGIERFSTSLASSLAEKDFPVYFDAQVTSLRAEAVRAALLAGKHIYCEKPLAGSLDECMSLVRLARQRKCKNGIVQDKLFLPGLRKLKRLIDAGFFGRIFSVRGEFGYWVFEGDWQPAQRPSWNYRAEDGGGIVLDMYAHWQYLLEGLFGPIKSLLCHAATHIPHRVDEQGRPYECTADDASYGIFEIEGGIAVQLNASWAFRVYRDDLFVMQVDGVHGTAVAGLRDCKVQHRSFTPKPVWNPDLPSPIDYRAAWQDVPANQDFDNAFKLQWEMFLRHIAEDAPFPHTLMEGAKGVQLAELALRSWRERRWVDVPALHDA